MAMRSESETREFGGGLSVPVKVLSLKSAMATVFPSGLSVWRKTQDSAPNPISSSLFQLQTRDGGAFDVSVTTFGLGSLRVGMV
jgi:hypothetical protein